MQQPHEHRPPRTLQTGLVAARQARAAIANVTSRLPALHSRAVFIPARALNARGPEARNVLAAECDEIERAISDARTELLCNLMETPPKVAGHSRVVDVEKSLDSLERSVAVARAALGSH